MKKKLSVRAAASLLLSALLFCAIFACTVFMVKLPECATSSMEICTFVVSLCQPDGVEIVIFTFGFTYSHKL